MFVRDWMAKHIWTIEEGRNLRDAKDMMMEHKVRRLPVTAGGILVGIITKEDIIAASPSIIDFETTDEIKRHLEQTNVASVMTEDPYTVETDDPIEQAALIMAEKKVGALPVLDSGKLVGIITETDIFRAFVKILGLAADSERLVLEVEMHENAVSTIIDKLKAEGRRILSMFSYDSRAVGKTMIIVRMAKGKK